jgi:F-type H+-transporting ATPase subunit b
MGTVYTILNSLKIDKSFYIQFILFTVFFNILAPLLFKKIQIILELRESKTTKLDSHANHVFKQAEELAEEYKGTVEKTHQDAQAVASKAKSEILSKERAILTSAEDKMIEEYEGKKSVLLKEFSIKRAAVMADASNLSNSLVEKLTK